MPLGLSDYSNEPEMRPHTTEEAAAVCDTVARWQEVFLSVLGRRLVFAADEYYLLAGRELPPAELYEGFPQHENGIGMARAFERAFLGDRSAALGVRHGFFSWVDGAPPRATGRPAARGPAVGRRPRDRPVTVVTGAYGARVLGPAPGRPPGCGCSRWRTGSSGGTSRWPACSPGPTSPAPWPASPSARYLLPDACLSEGRFLDGTTPGDLPVEVEVVASDGASLRAALDSRPSVVAPE